MSTIITDTDLLTRISMLPGSVKADVVDYIDKHLETESAAPLKNCFENSAGLKINLQW